MTSREAKKHLKHQDHLLRQVSAQALTLAWKSRRRLELIERYQARCFARQAKIDHARRCLLLIALALDRAEGEAKPINRAKLAGAVSHVIRILTGGAS